MSYSKTTWIDDTTPISASNMNNIENGVVQNESDILSARSESLIRDLNIMLNLALGMPSSGIDAWSDLFADTSNIDTANSSYYQVTGGSLSMFALQQLNAPTGGILFGYASNNCAYAAQTFTVPSWGSMTLSTAKVKLAKDGSPTDDVYAYIYATSGGAPTGSELYTSTNGISGSTLTTSYYSECTFTFSGATLSADTVYALVLKRSSSFDTNNTYAVGIVGTNPYSGGSAYSYDTSWSIETNTDFYFDFTVSNAATVICNAVTPTEALTYAAVCTEENAGTGSITWYLSDDGTNWTEITSLNAIQTMSFDEVALYLKCVLTGNATVSAVAYGGY